VTRPRMIPRGAHRDIFPQLTRMSHQVPSEVDDRHLRGANSRCRMTLPSLNRIVPRHHLVPGIHLGNCIIQKVGKTEVLHGLQVLHNQVPSEVTPIKGCHGRAPFVIVE